MTPTDITNLALGKLGANLIENIETDEATGVLTLHYNQSLKAQLRRHPWNFAASDPTDLATLTAPTPKPVDFDHLFSLPGDFLAVQSVAHERIPLDPLSYRVTKSGLWCAYDKATLVYTIAAPDLAQALPDFVEALSTLLASKLAAPILKSRTTARELLDEWLRIDLPAAINEDVSDSAGSLTHHARAAALTSPLVQARWNRTSSRAAPVYPVDPPS